MSVYFYCGHIARHGSVASVGAFCGLSIGPGAVSAYEDAMRAQVKEIQSITNGGAFTVSVIFDKFEKVE
ncbi:TPA: hypothetical protein ACJINZ_004388 [Escherichia coli]